MRLKQTVSQVGIVAPSGPAIVDELDLSVGRLERSGISVLLSSQCKNKHLFFAGSDEERAKAFFEMAQNNHVHTIWCARGGYGAIRILPILKQFAKQHGIPRASKLLIGCSDSTLLLDFVRREWGWRVLHGPMPGGKGFHSLSDIQWQRVIKCITHQESTISWQKKKLKFFGEPPEKCIRGLLVGGNLTVWLSGLGTPFEPSAHHHLLFLEDVSENLYRIDRMVQQLRLSGRFAHVRAIILGTFFNCEDSVLMLPVKNKPGKMKPLRRKLSQAQGLREIFTPISKEFRIPVAYGLSVGHGPHVVNPLPLGAHYELLADGRLSLLKW